MLLCSIWKGLVCAFVSVSGFRFGFDIIVSLSVLLDVQGYFVAPLPVRFYDYPNNVSIIIVNL